MRAETQGRMDLMDFFADSFVRCFLEGPHTHTFEQSSPPADAGLQTRLHLPWQLPGARAAASTRSTANCQQTGEGPHGDARTPRCKERLLAVLRRQLHCISHQISMWPSPF